MKIWDNTHKELPIMPGSYKCAITRSFIIIIIILLLLLLLLLGGERCNFSGFPPRVTYPAYRCYTVKVTAFSMLVLYNTIGSDRNFGKLNLYIPHEAGYQYLVFAHWYYMRYPGPWLPDLLIFKRRWTYEFSTEF